MSSPATNRQVPDNAILDANNKQTYLANQYVYCNGSITPGDTAEVPLVLLKNPAVTATGFPSGFVSLFCNFRKMTCLTASQTALLKFYIGSTVTTVGTTGTPRNLRPANTQNTRVGLITTTPTISANGNLVDFITGATLVQVQSSNLIVLDPGQTLLVTATASSNATALALVLGWYEI